MARHYKRQRQETMTSEVKSRLGGCCYLTFGIMDFGVVRAMVMRSLQDITRMTAPVIQSIERVSANRSYWTFSVLMVAQFMYVMDAFIMKAALPAIRIDLSATPSEIQGIIVLYLIAMATLLITGGRLGDIYGARLVFLIGLIGFTVASLLCGLAISAGMLVIARAAQGASAALMVPQVLATTHRLFQGADRGRRTPRALGGCPSRRPAISAATRWWGTLRRAGSQPT